MRRDHRPFGLKHALLRAERLYARRFLVPHFDAIGPGWFFVRPWHVQVFGPCVTAGAYLNVLAAADLKVRIAVWPGAPGQGAIRIGDHCLISPGVRIGCSCGVTIGNDCMLANGAYITDSDWHGLYDRVGPGKSAPVMIGDNVWIGDRAVVCKGVSIGDNSVIGAGAVVVDDVPANVVAAGNPARVVKALDPRERFVTRADWFRDAAELFRRMERFDREMLRANTWRHWLRYLLSPSRRD
jgi:acetyltransferase-like isoleucine patch superfamily enzyme